MFSRAFILIIGLFIFIYLYIQISTFVDLRRFFKKCDKTIDLFELAIELEESVKKNKIKTPCNIEIRMAFKKVRFNSFDDLYTYIEQCANEVLDHYEKIKDLDDDDGTISICKDAIMEIIIFIRKKRWLKQ